MSIFFYIFLWRTLVSFFEFSSQNHLFEMLDTLERATSWIKILKVFVTILADRARVLVTKFTQNLVFGKRGKVCFGN